MPRKEIKAGADTQDSDSKTVAVMHFLLGLLLASAAAATAPCDIFAAAGSPCVAAHSVVRSLYDNYAGPLNLVARTDTNATKEIGTTSRGFARAADQDKFCEKTSCTIKRIFDQSPHKNHLDVAPAGGNVHHGDKPVNASKHGIVVSGVSLYGAYFEGGMGYRNDNTSGIATGNEPETMYIVTSGKHFNGGTGKPPNGCCFDYGNAEVDNNDDGKATMEALYFGTGTHTWSKGSGSGPWVMADLEQVGSACHFFRSPISVY
jgi:hypothetical protein